MHSGIDFGARGIKFCQSGTARQDLIENDGWGILDSGQLGDFALADFVTYQIEGNELHLTEHYAAALDTLTSISGGAFAKMDFLKGITEGQEIHMEFDLQAIVDSINVLTNCDLLARELSRYGMI